MMMDLARDDLLRLYRLMVLARALADSATAATPHGKLPSLRGNEAVSVGAALALAETDSIMPQRHDLGAYLTRGISLATLLSRHLITGDMRSRLIAPPRAEGGKALAVAAGMALGTQLRAEERVTLVYTDPAAVESADGYEALRFAASRRLPLVLVIAAADTPPGDAGAALAAFVTRLTALDVPTTIIAGDDALAVYRATCAALTAAHADAGPVALVPPFARLPSPGSDHGEALAKANGHAIDPITRLADELIAREVLTAEECSQITAVAAETVAEAIVATTLLVPARPDGALFAAADATPLGPPLRVAMPVLSERGDYHL